MRLAIYREPMTGAEIEVRVRRQGRLNTRIVFDDGHDELVETKLLRFIEPAMCDGDERSRIVPITPLRHLYREMRNVQGNPVERFNALRDRLGWDSAGLPNRHGPIGSAFVSELFLRSRSHMARYINDGEGFYKPGYRPQWDEQNTFANRFVELAANAQIQFNDGAPEFDFVDYEISPIRTTRSCWENGRSAMDSGAGGMDLLLKSQHENTWLPAVGEIKACTETVGPTFALMQALTYAAELVTVSQWERLNRHSEHFREICTPTMSPRVDVFLIFEEPNQDTEDFQYAQTIARGLLQEGNNRLQSVRRIIFLKCCIENDEIAHLENIPL